MKVRLVDVGASTSNSVASPSLDRAAGPGARGRRRWFFCPTCTVPSAVRTMLGYVADDGSVGLVAGIACYWCRDIAEEPGASLIPGKMRVNLRGVTAAQWLITMLRAGGADPRPRARRVVSVR